MEQDIFRTSLHTRSTGDKKKSHHIPMAAPQMFVDRFIIWSRARKVKEVWRYMERQSEQELLATVPVETESLEGNRIYQVQGEN